MNPKLQFSSLQLWCWPILVATLVLICYGPALWGKYDYNDDFTLIWFGTKDRIHEQFPERPGLLEHVKTEAQRGRFMPVFTSYIYLMGYFLGRNPLGMYLVASAIALASALLLYRAAREFFGPPWLGAFFAIAVMITNESGPAETWIYLIRGEKLGIPLLAASLYCLVVARRQSTPCFSDWLGLFYFGLASLTKENFILLTPAMVMARLWTSDVEGKARFRDRWRPLLPVVAAYVAWAILVALLIGWIAFSGGGTSHGGRSLHPSWTTVLGALAGPDGILRNLLPQAIWFIPCLGWLWGTMQRRTPFHQRQVLLLGGFVCLWVLPQIVIYGTRGEMFGRYWLPMTIGLLLPSGLALQRLYEAKSCRWIFAVVCLAVTIWILRCGQVACFASLNHANRTRVWFACAEQVAKAVPSPAKVLLVAGPKSEHAITFLNLMGLFDRGGTQIFLSQPDGTDGFPSFCLKTGESGPPLNQNEFDAIVYLPGSRHEDEGQRKSPAASNGWQRRVAGKQYYLSLRKMQIETTEYAMVFDRKIIRDNP